ncbi:MAG: FliM/FliN family flagellar motor switch protein [Phycisphaerae bacterium]|jgi:flagellar motor switch protein FliN/FliY
MNKQVNVRLELGRRLIPAAEAWRLDIGGVVELDRQADDRVDVYADGRLVARGQPVVVSGKLAVRIEEIVSPYAGSIR